MPNVYGDMLIARRLKTGVSRVAWIGDSRANGAQFYSMIREWEPDGGWDGQQFLHSTSRTGGDDTSVAEIGAEANARLAKTGQLQSDDGLTGGADDGNDYDDGLVKERTAVGLNTAGPTGASSKRGPTEYTLYTCDSAGTIPAVSSSDNVIGRRRPASGTIRDSFEANATTGTKIIGGVLRHSNAPTHNIRVGFTTGGSTSDQSSYTSVTQAGSDPTLVIMEAESSGDNWPTYELEGGAVALGDTILLTPLVQMVKDADAGGMLVVDAQNFGSRRLWHHLADDCSSDANFGTWWSAIGIDTIAVYLGENDDGPDLSVTGTASTAEFFEAQVRRLIARFRSEVSSSVEVVLFFQHKATTPDSDHPAMATACKTIAEDTEGVLFCDLYNYYQAQVADGFDADGVHPSSTAGYQTMGAKTWELIEEAAAMADITSDLEVDYQFNGNGDDSTDNGRDLSFTGSPTFEDVVGGKAIVLDGSTQYGTATGYKGILGTGARTIVIDVETGDGSDQTLCEWGTGGTGGVFRIGLDEDETTPNAGAWTSSIAVGNGFVKTTAKLNGTGMNQLVYVLPDSADIEDLVAYVNAVVDPHRSSAPRAVNTASHNDMLVGRGAAGGSHLNGKIKRFRVYSRALSADDVAALHARRPSTQKTNIATDRATNRSAS